MTANKHLERKLRRALDKCGYALHKSRAMLSPDNLGGYMIVDLQTNAVGGGSRFELSLDDVQEFANMYA